MNQRVYVLFKKHPDCAPATWWWTVGEASPTVSCPKCQALHHLDHKVAAGGELDPSVVCTRCEFHEWARLLDWTHGEKDFRRENAP